MTLSATALRLLEDLPPFEQASPTIQRTIDAMARELDRVDAAVAAVRGESLPSTAAVVLKAWEQLFGLPVEAVGKTLAQRRAAVLAYLQALGSSGSGLDWEASMNALIGTGWDYLEYVAPALRDRNEIADPRASSTGNYVSNTGTAVTVTLTPVSDPDLNGFGLEGTYPANQGTWNIMRPANVASRGDGPVTPGDWVAVGVRIKLMTVPTAANLQFYLYCTKADGTNSYIALMTPNTPIVGLPAGTIIDLAGRAQVPASAEIAGISVIMSTPGVGDTPKVRFGRLQVNKIAGSTAPIPAYFNGSMDKYDWTGTVNDSPSIRESPAAYTVRIYMPFSAALATPAQPSGTPSGGGGTTYFWSVTATNFFGETLASPDRSTNLPAAGNVLLDWPDVVGATGYRVYRGTSTSNKQLVAATTLSTYTDTGGAAISSTPPPTSNSSQSTQIEDARRLARAITPANLDIEIVSNTGFIVGVTPLGSPL